MAEQPVALSDLVAYLNEHRHLLEHCHSRYTTEGLMLMLDSPKLCRLKKEFKLYPDGLQLPVFLFTMREIFQGSVLAADKYDMVDGLVSLFQSIDIDGDGHLLWQEFTEYIIEIIRKLDRPALHTSEREIIQAAYARLGREYKLQYTAELNLANAIRKFVYVEQLEGFLSLEGNSTSVKVYDMQLKAKEILQFPASKWYYYVQDFAVDEEGTMLAALLPDGVYFLPLKYRPGRCVLTCRDLDLAGYCSVWWLPQHRYWAFGSSSGDLKICSMLTRSRTAVECSVIYHRHHHAETITMLREIDETEMLCSCSLDGTVKLLSLNSLKVSVFDEMEGRANEGKGNRGYLGFDYNNEFGRLVMLYGFNTAISLHSLDLSLTKTAAGRYCQHTASIRHARFVKGNPLVISVDEKCCVRIWNYRTMRTHQIIDGDRLFSSQSELLVVPQLDSFYMAERKIASFRSVSFFKRAKELNHRPLDFHYNSYLGGFWMFTNSDARHYDTLNGRLRQILTRLTDDKCEYVVTAIEFGPKCRKLYIGDAGGFLREYSTETGEFIQELRPLEDFNDYQQIRRILYVKEEDLVLCASLDGRILVFSRNESSEYVLVRDLRGCHSTDLTGMCYSEEYHLMATSCEGGTVNIWNSVKYTLENVLVADEYVIDVRFVKGYPILLVCTESKILCFGVPPIHESRRYRCIFKVSASSEFNSLGRITSFDAMVKRGSLQLDLKNTDINNILNTDEGHVLMCVGESLGNAATFCLDSPFRQFHVDKAQRIEVEEPSHPRRYDHCYIDKQVQSFLTKKNASDGLVSCPQVPFAEVLIASWQAHQGPILKIKLQKEPFVVMTGGEDQKFKIFDLCSTAYGVVNCENFKSTFWKMPQVNIKRRLKQIDFVLYIFGLIDGEQLTELQREAVKTRMLMDRYMDDEDKQRFQLYLRALRTGNSSSGMSTPALTAQICLHQNPTFKQNYELALESLKERLMNIDNDIAMKRTRERLSAPAIEESSVDRRKPTESKQIRSLKVKLQAIEQHLQPPSPPHREPSVKEKKPKPTKRKNGLFVSYGQLRRNLTAMHKMLRINNIR